MQETILNALTGIADLSSTTSSLHGNTFNALDALTFLEPIAKAAKAAVLLVAQAMGAK